MQIRNEGSGWIDIMVVSNVNFKWVIFCVPFRITHPQSNSCYGPDCFFREGVLEGLRGPLEMAGGVKNACCEPSGRPARFLREVVASNHIFLLITNGPPPRLIWLQQLTMPP